MQSGLLLTGGDLSQPPGNFQPPGRATRPQSGLLPPGGDLPRPPGDLPNLLIWKLPVFHVRMSGPFLMGAIFYCVIAENETCLRAKLSDAEISRFGTEIQIRTCNSSETSFFRYSKKLLLHVASVFYPVPIASPNKLKKQYGAKDNFLGEIVKNRQYLNFDAARYFFLPEWTFSTYPHKF
jgi:hypothetical protein